MNNKWVLKNEDWNDQVKWFLVDEGMIQYAFKSEKEARDYKNEFHLSYMFLTDIENITHETMIDPHECRCWVNKEQKYVVREFE